MPTEAQLTLVGFINHRCKGLPYKRRTRLSILSHLSDHKGAIKSSNDLTEAECIDILDKYHEAWREKGVLPTDDEALHIRRLAVAFSKQWVSMLGESSEGNKPLSKKERKVKRAQKRARYRANKKLKRMVQS